MKSRKINRPMSSLALILFAVLLLAGCSKQTSENSAPINRDLVQAPVDPETLVAPPEVENTVEQINTENFDKIKNGMSLLDVEIIIAGTNRKVTSKTQNGKLSETYRWELPGSSRFIEVAFEDEKVVGKNQKGLK